MIKRETLTKAIQDYHNGMRVQDILTKHDISRHTLYRHLDTKRKRPDYHLADKYLAYGLHLKGMTPKMIAANLGYTVNTIYVWLRAFNERT